MANSFVIQTVFNATGNAARFVSHMATGVGKATRSIRGNIGLINDKLKGVSRTARQAFGVAGIAGAAFVAQRALRSVITTGAEFQQTMVDAAARFPGGIDQGTAAFKELEDAARATGAATVFTATEAAGGIKFMAKAGFDAAQTLALLPEMVGFAVAAEMDLARATDVATDSLGAFNLNTKDAVQLQKNMTLMTNQMAKAANISNQSVEELFETMIQGGPAATAAGAPMSELLALTAQFTTSGLKASASGTALKNIYLKLADIDVQDVLGGEFGVDVLDPKTRELRAFADIMEDLSAAFDARGLSGAERVGEIGDLFGLRGVTGVANVLSAGVGSLRGFQASVLDSIGFVDKLAKKVSDTLNFEMKQLGASVESTNLTFFAANEGGIRAFTTGMTDLVREVDLFLGANPEISKMAAGIFAVGGGALISGLVLAGIAAGAAFVVASPFALAGLATAALVALAAAENPADNLGGARLPTNTFAGRHRRGAMSAGSFRQLQPEGSFQLGPSDALGRILDRAGSINRAELKIMGLPGPAEISGSLGSGITIDVAPEGEF